MVERMICRAAQSVLHQEPLPRERADWIGERIAKTISQPGQLAKAAQRYRTGDALEIGEMAAREYLRVVLKR